MTYFLPISVGTFTKGLGFADLGRDLAGARAVHSRSLTLLSLLLLRKQETLGACDAQLCQHLLARHQGAAQLLPATGCCSASWSIRSRSPIIAQAQSNSQELHNASIGIVDEDNSELSRRIARAFLPPYFKPPQQIAERDIDQLMNTGTIHLHHRHSAEFPARRARRTQPVGADQCRRHRDGAGRHRLRLRAADHHTEIAQFCRTPRGAPLLAGQSGGAHRFNPNVTTAWFTSVMGIINNMTMLAIILAGAAIVREREHGTMDHLLVDAAHARSRSPCPRSGRTGSSSRWRSACRSTLVVRQSARHPDRRLGAAVHARRRALSVLRHRDRHLSRHRSRARCRSSACSTC